MNLATRAAFMTKARHDIDKALLQLNEVSTHLTDDAELAALGALSGLSGQIQYIETVLTIMRDLQTHQDWAERRKQE
ncbi:MAG: hypothetical protein JWO13_438 [Acidobacteriales bacterium]|nr:hypothetical protein [Terriglobales bacterium]